MKLSIPRTGVRITKDFLLSKNSEETYMSTYLGVPVKTQGLFKSPLRKDNRPTAGFYRDKKNHELKFHDFGIGFDGNFLNVVMHLHNCSYVQALNIVAEDFGYIEKTTERPDIKIRKTSVKVEEKTDTQIQIEDQPFTEKEIAWWKAFGVSESTLKKYKVHSCKNVFLNGNYFTSSSERNAAYGYFGGMKNGTELWRIYFPQKRAYRFLSNWGKNLIQGARQIPKSGDLLVITKSMKDCMALYEMGIPAIAPCSEVLFISDEQLEKLKSRFKHIVVLYDNDQPGIQGMRRIKKQHPELKYFFIPRKYGAKDTSDFIRKYGVKKAKEYINQAKEFFCQD